jgi:uncharacterized protein YnzC (UPF0291/DUF896 family)
LEESFLERAKIERINVLAKKAKSEGLTDDEIIERDALRKEYLADIKANFKATLDNVEIVDEK